MITTVKTEQTKTKIRFQDCDPFGHLNNSKYLDYMLNAREDHLKELGIDLHTLGAQQGISWVVGAHEINYKQPALFNEDVIIESRLIGFAKKWAKAEMIMWNAEKSVIKAVLWTTFIHIDLKSQKSIEHNTELLSLMQEMLDPVNESNAFERISNLS